MLSSTGSRLLSPGTAAALGNLSRSADAAGLSRGRSSRLCRAMLLKATCRRSGRIRTPLLTTRRPADMSGDVPRQGMLDTNIMILRRWIDPGQLPDEMAISAITLAELSAGPHEVRRNSEQDIYDEHAERARRLEILQRAESEFDPIPFGAEAARIFGRVTAAVIAAGRKPRRRIADLLIAATAIAEGLPLFTTNPGDYTGLDTLLPVIQVTRPAVPHERTSGR
jgi:predicted nucleic acid-binding protein